MKPLAAPEATVQNDRTGRVVHTRHTLKTALTCRARDERHAIVCLYRLRIHRDRAENAWRHAERNVSKMRVESPIDGMVVLKATWKNGSMGEVQEGEEVRSGLPILDGSLNSSAPRSDTP